MGRTLPDVSHASTRRSRIARRTVADPEPPFRRAQSRRQLPGRNGRSDRHPVRQVIGPIRRTPRREGRLHDPFSYLARRKLFVEIEMRGFARARAAIMAFTLYQLMPNTILISWARTVEISLNWRDDTLLPGSVPSVCVR
jgi:hypothetical protein